MTRLTYPLLNPIDDLRHDIGNAPHARESLAYMLQLPDFGLHITVYTWISAEGLTGRVFCAYGPALNEPIFEFLDGVEGGNAQDFDNWSVAGVQIRHLRPLEQVEIAYHGKEAQFEAKFEATSPAYAHTFSDDAKGPPPFLASNRYEQAGRVVGFAVLRGQKIEFHGHMHRDHSWGVRDWALAQHWKWFNAQTDSASVYVFEISGLGRQWLYGFIDRDGLAARVKSVVIDVDYDDHWFQRCIEIEVTDDAGRTTLITGERYAQIPWPVHPKLTLHEAPMRCKIDGELGVGHLEVAWSSDYLKSLRGEP